MLILVCIHTQLLLTKCFQELKKLQDEYDTLKNTKGKKDFKRIKELKKQISEYEDSGSSSSSSSNQIKEFAIKGMLKHIIKSC